MHTLSSIQARTITTASVTLHLALFFILLAICATAKLHAQEDAEKDIDKFMGRAITVMNSL